MGRPTYILGINAYHGDASAALVRDGELVAAVEEERFRRIKHWAGFPSEAIRSCLEIGGIDGSRIDHIAIGRDSSANLRKKLAFAVTKRPDPSLVLDRIRHGSRFQKIEEPLAETLGVSRDDLARIHRVEHHLAHLASSFFVSPFEESAVCAIDGFGDFVSTSWGVGKDNKLELTKRTFFPHSLGILYSAVTQFLGFHSYGDEFKVMGLAPYGRPEYAGDIRRLVELLPGGDFRLVLDYFQHWSGGVRMEWESGYPTLGILYTDRIREVLGEPRNPGDPLTDRHEDIAASLQAVFEECAAHILTALWEETGLSRLCLAGGCAMNSVANGKIRELTPFSEVFIQPASADNGTALGAAFFTWNHILDGERRFVMKQGYWGPSHQEPDLETLLADDIQDSGFLIQTFEDEESLCEATARLIADGNVVGWYQGRMEWGARALGNRSIVADPRRKDVRDLINAKIKYREKFRPFAPSVAEDALDDYFVGAVPDPFMLQVYPVREDKKEAVPAITHVDGSGRLQTVSAETNPRYFKLIDAFRKLTGVPILLNTSFNENEPIVDTPRQAVDCFLRTKMDAIVVNNSIARRATAASSRSPDQEDPRPAL